MATSPCPNEHGDTFGAWLREQRKTMNMSQRSLGERAGLSFTYLSHIERGTVPVPSEEAVRNIARALEIDEYEALHVARILPADLRALLLAWPAAEWRFLAENGLMSCLGGVMGEPYFYSETDEVAKPPRVVILIDGNSQKILENEAGVRLEFVRWSEIANNPEMPAEGIYDLQRALDDRDLDAAIRISDMLTAELPDDEEKSLTL